MKIRGHSILSNMEPETPLKQNLVQKAEKRRRYGELRGKILQNEKGRETYSVFLGDHLEVMEEGIPHFSAGSIHSEIHYLIEWLTLAASLKDFPPEWSQDIYRNFANAFSWSSQRIQDFFDLYFPLLEAEVKEIQAQFDAAKQAWEKEKTPENRKHLLKCQETLDFVSRQCQEMEKALTNATKAVGALPQEKLQDYPELSTLKKALESFSHQLGQIKKEIEKTQPEVYVEITEDDFQAAQVALSKVSSAVKNISPISDDDELALIASELFRIFDIFTQREAAEEKKQVQSYFDHIEKTLDDPWRWELVKSKVHAAEGVGGKALTQEKRWIVAQADTMRKRKEGYSEKQKQLLLYFFLALMGGQFLGQMIQLPTIASNLKKQADFLASQAREQVTPEIEKEAALLGTILSTPIQLKRLAEQEETHKGLYQDLERNHPEVLAALFPYLQEGAKSPTSKEVFDIQENFILQYTPSPLAPKSLGEWLHDFWVGDYGITNLSEKASQLKAEIDDLVIPGEDGVILKERADRAQQKLQAYEKAPDVPVPWKDIQEARQEVLAIETEVARFIEEVIVPVKKIEQQALYNLYWKGHTALHVAVHLSDARSVEYLVKRGADVNAKNASGETPFHVAATKGNNQIVQEFVKAGADVNAKNGDGNTALMLAALSGNSENVKYLLERGADVNTKNNYGETVLTLVAQSRDSENVKYLLERGADVNTKNNNGYTALILAAESGNVEAMKCLLDRGANIDAQTNQGMTPLHAALLGPVDEKIIEYLLDQGADVNAKNSAGYTPFDMLSLPNEIRRAPPVGERKKMKELLIGRGARSGARESFLFEEVAGSGNVETVKDLLDSGEVDVNVRNHNGETPLFLAASSENLKVVAFLLEHGANPNIKDSGGRSALDEPARSGNEKMVKCLVEGGANVNLEKDRDEVAPLHWAADSGNIEVAKYLLEQGADINAESRDGTPLDWAADVGTEEMQQFLHDHGAKFRNLGARAARLGEQVDVFSSLLGEKATALKERVDNVQRQLQAREETPDGKEIQQELIAISCAFLPEGGDENDEDGEKFETAEDHPSGGDESSEVG